MTLAKALGIADALKWCEGVDDEYGGPYERLRSLLDTPDSDETIVAAHGDELADLTGIASRRKLRRWLRIVRPVLLTELADDFDRCEDAYGSGDKLWVVSHGMVVSEGSVAHREMERVVPTPVRVGVVARPRPGTRGRRRRSMASRGSRSRSPSREPDEPEPPRGRRQGARAAR